MIPLPQPPRIEGTFVKGIIYRRPRAGSRCFTWGVEIKTPDGETQLWKTMRAYESDGAAMGAMRNWVVGFRFWGVRVPHGHRLVSPKTDLEIPLRDVQIP